MPYKTVVYDRSRLYEEVWAEPVEVVARRYGVSGVALAKTCRKLGVPLPGRGHWARQRAGQKVSRPPLPRVKKGQPEDLHVARHSPPTPKPTLSKETELVIARETAADATIVVSAKLEKPHALVAMSLSAKLLVRARPFNGAVRVSDQRCLDVSISPGELDRGLRIMDALLKALEFRKLRVEVTDVRPDARRHGYYERDDDNVASNATRVMVADEWIQISLAEKIAQKRSPPPPAPKHVRGTEADIWQRLQPRPVEYVPTGELTLSMINLRHLSVRTTWRDGKHQRVEGCLNDFVSSLYVVADAIKAQRAERERQRRQYEEAEKRRHEQQLRAEEEARRMKELNEVIRDWRFARDVRAYIAEARGMVAEAGLSMVEGTPFDEWLKFASTCAEKLDPLAGLRADITRVVAEKAEAKKTDSTRGQVQGPDDS